MNKVNQLDSKTIEEVKFIVNKSLANVNYEVFIFGSWTNGTARENSDIDIGVIASDSADSQILENLRQELLNSNIPYFIEVVDFNTISNDFKEVALSNIIPIKNNE